MPWVTLVKTCTQATPSWHLAPSVLTWLFIKWGLWVCLCPPHPCTCKLGPGPGGGGCKQASLTVTRLKMTYLVYISPMQQKQNGTLWISWLVIAVAHIQVQANRRDSSPDGNQQATHVNLRPQQKEVLLAGCLSFSYRVKKLMCEEWDPYLCDRCLCSQPGLFLRGGV